VAEEEGLEGVEEAGELANPRQLEVMPTQAQAQPSADEGAEIILEAALYSRKNRHINIENRRNRIAVEKVRGGPVRRH